MEKALEILKELRSIGAWEKWCLSLPNNTKINDAIAELEEAMKPKTCATCKNLYINSFDEWVDYCKELNIEISHSTQSTFCCNRHESKE